VAVAVREGASLSGLPADEDWTPVLSAPELGVTVLEKAAR
jgi:hypothetical protein